MSLIAQMQRDRQQGEPDARSNELPLFAAAEAIAASKRKRSSLLVLAPAVLVPVLIIVAPVLVGNHFVKNSRMQAPGIATVATATVIKPNDGMQAVAPHGFITSASDAVLTTVTGSEEGGSVAGPEADVQEARTKTIAVREEPENLKPVPPPHVASGGDQRIEVPAKLAAVSVASENKPTRKASNISAEVIDFKRVAPQSAPQRDRILLGRASELVEHGSAEMARQLLQSEIGQSMEYPDSAALLGSLLVEQRAFGRAAEMLASYISAHPGHRALQITQLRLELSQGMFEQVLQSVNTMSPQLRDRVDVIEMQAAALQSLGDYSSASYCYRQLLRRDDTNARWWMGLAVALDADAQAQEARSAYTMALEHRGLGAALGQYARQRLTQL